MAADDTTNMPEDITSPSTSLADEPIEFSEGEESSAELECEVWELIPEREPAPFLAGSYEADALQANLSAVGSVEADDVQVNLSVVGMAKADWFESIGSAVALATVAGDAEVNTSAIPLLHANGDVNFHQAYASAVIAGDAVNVHQGGSPMMLAKQLKVNQGGAAVMIAGEATVNRGFVGLLMSRDAIISDDSRVLVDSKAAAFVSAALLAGMGMIAFALMRGMSGIGTRFHHHRG